MKKKEMAQGRQEKIPSRQAARQTSRQRTFSSVVSALEPPRLFPFFIRFLANYFPAQLLMTADHF
jgi:hypothetical protein